MPDASAVAGGFLEAAVRTATPLALAALGELVTERAGVINLGLEGAIVAGAFGALVGAGAAAGPAGALAGFAVGALAGVATAGLFAVFAVVLRADQIITGTAVTLAALGVTGTFYRTGYGAAGAALGTPTAGPLAVPGLSAIPVLGPALFTQPAVTYLLYFLVPALWWFGTRTHAGLALRAVGERPDAAAAAGVRPRRVQLAATLFGGLMAGVSGATLVIAQAGTFAEGMSAGRGFIAVAVVVLGRWHPGGVALAALLFGAASALQYLFQSMGWALPYQLFLALPYLLTLVVLAGAAGRVAAPAALGRRALGFVLAASVLGVGRPAHGQPVAPASVRSEAPAAARVLALPGVRWIHRATPHADVYVLAGSAAEGALASLPNDVERAVAADVAWLNVAAPGPRLRLFFVGAREQMRPLVGWTPAGYAEVGEGTAFFVASADARPALRHEVMHLLSWRHWGRPGGTWISEGVATNATAACGGLAVDDVAAVLAREGALPSLDTLRRHFDVRGRTGAVQYLASASLVRHVDRVYGRPALRALWASGLRGVDGALGVPADALERGWRAALARRAAPPVSWGTLWGAIAARGCE